MVRSQYSVCLILTATGQSFCGPASSQPAFVHTCSFDSMMNILRVVIVAIYAFNLPAVWDCHGGNVVITTTVEAYDPRDSSPTPPDKTTYSMFRPATSSEPTLDNDMFHHVAVGLLKGVGVAFAAGAMYNALRSHFSETWEVYRTNYSLPSLEDARNINLCEFRIPVEVLTNGNLLALYEGDAVVNAVESGRLLEIRSSARDEFLPRGVVGKVIRALSLDTTRFTSVVRIPRGCVFTRHLPASFSLVFSGKSVVTAVHVTLPREEFAIYSPSPDPMPSTTRVDSGVGGFGVVPVGRCFFEASGAILNPVDKDSLSLTSSLGRYRVTALRMGAPVTLAELEFPCECKPDSYKNVVFWVEKVGEEGGQVEVKVFTKVTLPAYSAFGRKCFSTPLQQLPHRFD